VPGLRLGRVLSTPFTVQNFERLLGAPGFSEQLLKNHFTLYQGYVKNTNDLVDKFRAAVKAGQSSYELAELHRRFGWEFNGMRMHELYFSNMTKVGKPLDAKSALMKKINEQFGSFDAWAADFKAVGSMRGIGWVVLYLDRVTGQLFNVWINEHDVGHLTGGVKLLVMDVFEHAFMTDYGTKRADYIEALFKAIDWKAVEARLV
jgi:Fe-Mn family superoxide dismutase